MRDGRCNTTKGMSAFVSYYSETFLNEEHQNSARAQIREHAVKVTSRKPKVVVNRSKRRTRPQALRTLIPDHGHKRVEEDIDNLGSCKRGTNLKDLVPLFQPSRGLALDRASHVLPRFFSQQVDTPHEVGFPVWTEPFVDLLVRSPPDSLVGLSLSALAAEYDHPAQNPELNQAVYSKAISALRVSIQGNQSTAMEAIMCSVILLGVWEGLVAMRNSTTVRVIHQNAGIELLRSYGNRVLKNATTRHMAQTLLARYIWACYLPLAPQMTEAVDLPSGLYAYTYRAGIPPLEELASNVASLRYAAKDFWVGVYNPVAVNEERRNELANLAVSVDSQLEYWQNMLPLSFQPRRVHDIRSIDHSIRRAGMYKDLCDIYPSHEKAQNYNRWRILKLFCLVTIVLIKRESVAFGIVRSIRGLLDRICASVPFHLGNLGSGTLSDLKFPPIIQGLEFTNRHGHKVIYTDSHHAWDARSRTDLLMLEILSFTMLAFGYPNSSKMQEILQLLHVSPSDDLEGQIEWIIGQLQRAVSLRSRPQW